MKNGDAYTADVEHPRGTPENPLSRGEMEQKFVGCAKEVLSEDQVQAAVDLLKHFEEVSDVGDLSRVLTGTS
jgi:2-methylcitrate dehydratase PrpD